MTKLTEADVLTEAEVDAEILRGSGPLLNEDVLAVRAAEAYDAAARNERPPVSESAPVEEDFASTREWAAARSKWREQRRLRAFLKGEGC